MVKTSNLKEKSYWVKKKLAIFYRDPCNLDQFIQCVYPEDKSDRLKIRLRTVEWFVTNYAKKYNVSYPIKRPNGEVDNFSVFQSYRKVIDSYPKVLFDPYCRGETFFFESTNHIVVEFGLFGFEIRITE